MTNPGSEFDKNETSLFAIATILLRRRLAISCWAFVGAVLAYGSVATRPKFYPAAFSFVPQSGDAVRSGFASLAGQLGISAPAGSQSQQPEFYVTLAASRSVLLPIVRDTLIVNELGGKRL